MDSQHKKIKGYFLMKRDMATKITALILLAMLQGCTYAKYKDFTFISFKEFDSFEASYMKDGSATVKAKNVKAFEGQKIFVDAVKTGAKTALLP